MSMDSTHACIVVDTPANLESTAESSPKTQTAESPRTQIADSPKTPSADFSSEIIVTNRDEFLFTALRYHIEQVREPTDNASEVIVLDAGKSTCRVVPLATGWGTVRSRGEPDIGYDIFEDQISLMSSHKRFLYDFVYEAVDAYSEIKNLRDVSN